MQCLVCISSKEMHNFGINDSQRLSKRLLNKGNQRPDEDHQKMQTPVTGFDQCEFDNEFPVHHRQIRERYCYEISRKNKTLIFDTRSRDLNSQKQEKCCWRSIYTPGLRLLQEQKQPARKLHLVSLYMTLVQTLPASML